MTAVREHPGWYFRSGRFDLAAMLGLLVSEAVATGSDDVHVERVGQWWVVRSAHDWLGGDLVSFFGLTPHPTIGPNTSRVEVLLTAFCRSVWTSRNGERYDVTVTGDPPQEVRDLLSGTGRVIAFLPPAEVAGETQPHLTLVESEQHAQLEQAIEKVRGFGVTPFDPHRGP